MSRLLALACALAFAGQASAESADDACEREVKQRIVANHEGATKIDFERGFRDGDERTGFGHWRASNGSRVLFRYECRFAGKSNQVKAASFDVVRTSERVREERERGDVSEMERECKSAVRSELRREHPRADDFELRGSTPEWRESSRVFGMAGRGELTGGSGRERDFSWRCDYDAVARRVKDVDVSLLD